MEEGGRWGNGERKHTRLVWAVVGEHAVLWVVRSSFVTNCFVKENMALGDLVELDGENGDRLMANAR